MSLKSYQRLPFKVIEDAPRRIRIVDKNGKVVMFSDSRQYLKMDEDEYNELFSLLEMMVRAGNEKGKKFLDTLNQPVSLTFADFEETKK